MAELDKFVGGWAVEGTTASDPPLTAHGRSTFEWLTESSFLIERWYVAHPDFPDGIAIIGPDVSAETYRQHYFDSRGLSRIYEMSLCATTSGGCGETHRASRNVSLENSATMAKGSPAAGRSPVTGRTGNMTSTSTT